MSLKNYRVGDLERGLIKAERRAWNKHVKTLQDLVSSGRQSEIPNVDKSYKLSVVKLKECYSRKF